MAVPVSCPAFLLPKSVLISCIDHLRWGLGPVAPGIGSSQRGSASPASSGPQSLIPAGRRAADVNVLGNPRGTFSLLLLPSRRRRASPPAVCQHGRRGRRDGRAESEGNKRNEACSRGLCVCVRACGTGQPVSSEDVVGLCRADLLETRPGVRRPSPCFQWARFRCRPTSRGGDLNRPV